MITESSLNPNCTSHDKRSLQPLDVSNLITNKSLLFRHDLRPSIDHPPPSHGDQGLDNVAFDLEGLEHVEAGSRKPLVGVHVRTVSAEEFVRSTLRTRSARSRPSQKKTWINGGCPATAPILRGSSNNHGSVLHPIGNCVRQAASNLHLSRSAEKEDDQRALELAAKKLAFRKEHKNSTLKFLSSPKKELKESAVEVKNNHINNDNNDNSKENNQQMLWNRKNQQSLQGHSLNIICNKSLPSNDVKTQKKTDTKKTGDRSPLSDDARQRTSLAKTMVRVGGVSVGISPPFSQHEGVSSPLKVVIGDISPSKLPPQTNVSQVSVMNNMGVNTMTKVPNVVQSVGVISSPSTSSSSTFAPSVHSVVVSALSKVSSVRIVPSPNGTPTPSVIGVRPSSSNASCTDDVVPDVTAASHSNKSSVKSSHSYGPFQAVKRHLNSIRHGPDNTSNIRSQQPLFALLQGSRNSHESGASGSGQSRIVTSSHESAASSSAPNQNGEGAAQTPELLLQQQLVKQQQPSQQQSTNTSEVQLTPDPLRDTGNPFTQGEIQPPNSESTQVPENPRREGRERRRERRERRRERRALRTGLAPPVPSGAQLQTDLGPEPRPLPHHLPDLLNSHIPPPYSTLPNGPRSLGGLLGPPPTVGAPPPLSLQMPPPPGPPLVPLGPFHPPPGPSHGSPIRPPLPDNPWHLFGSRRSRGSRRAHSYLGDEDAKSCCGLLVTQAVSIRWFIIMISFVGLCCTVVGTVLGAVKTNSSEYVTITLLMIGVGIVLITVSGVAWHLTSRDAPCRVMLGLSPNDSGRGETRRFMARMAPSFGRPHHPYAAMMYPEFQYRPPPPSYQASMQEYRLRLFLLDRHGNSTGTQQFSAANILPSPPPTYRTGPFNVRGIAPGTLGRESDYSRPPSYRSREGSITHHPDAPPSVDPSGGGGVGMLTPAHSRDPSCLSFLSNEGSARLGRNSKQGSTTTTKFPVVETGTQGDQSNTLIPSTSSKKGDKGPAPSPKDDNTVTIVQTTDCSHVIGSESVIVTVSGSELTNHRMANNNNGTEISVLAHL